MVVPVPSSEPSPRGEGAATVSGTNSGFVRNNQNNHPEPEEHQQDDSGAIESMLSAMYDESEVRAIEEAERDVLGTRSVPPPATTDTLNSETSEMRLTGCLGVLEAMEALPHHQTEAYKDAVRKNEPVVKLETPVERFLLASEFNYWQAAEKLALYWTKRREIFGRERYHLPLRMDGSGAMSPEGYACFVDGLACIMPRDKFHRGVFLADAENLNEACQQFGPRLEALFYVLHALSEDEQVVTNGYVFLVAAGDWRRKQQNKEECDDASTSGPDVNHPGTKTRPNSAGLSLMLSGAIPSQFRALHLLARNKSNSIMSMVMNLWITIFRSFDFVNRRLRVHFPHSLKESFAKELDDYGLSTEHLPERFGGSSDGIQWYLDRLELEQKRYAELSTNQSLDLTKSTIADSDTSSPQEIICHAEREKNLKRKMEEIHWHNKEQMAKRKIRKLNEEKTVIQAQNRVLEAKYVCAKYISEQHEAERRLMEQLLYRKIEAIVSSRKTINDNTKESGSHEEITKRVQSLMNELFVFHGRNCLSGRWEFSATGAKISCGGVLGADDIRLIIDDIQSQPSNSIVSLQRQTLEALEEICKQRLETQGNDDDAEMEALTISKEKLIQENEFLSKERSYLESCLVLVEEIESNYSRYLDSSRDELATEIDRVFTKVTGFDTIYHGDTRLFDAHAVADRLLKQIWYVGHPVLVKIPDTVLENLIRMDGEILPPLPKTTDVNTATSSFADKSGVSFSTSCPSDNAQAPGHQRKSVRERQQAVYRRRKPHLKRL